MKREIVNFEVIPPCLLPALRLYPELPGAWLLVDPWSHVDPGLTTEDALGFLAEVIVELVSDENKQALLKFVPLGWLVLRQKLRMPREMISILKNYPGGEASRPFADSLIGASFGIWKSADYCEHPELEIRPKSLVGQSQDRPGN